MNLLAEFEVEAVVERPVEVGRDAYNEPVYGEPEREAVRVLAMPVEAEGLGADRPHGDRASVRVCFPKAYDGPLKGCTLEIGGHAYRIVGDPRPYPACPTAYDRVADAVDVHG